MTDTIRLITATGALDRPAIAAEIERRCAARKARWIAQGDTEARADYFLRSERTIITHHVEREAIHQRHPFVEAAFRYTALERRQIDTLRDRANAQPVCMGGNVVFRKLWAQIELIMDCARQRAIDEVEGAQVVLQAAE
jgi:hypothetical protein